MCSEQLQGELAAWLWLALSYSPDLTLWLPLLFTMGLSKFCPKNWKP